MARKGTVFLIPGETCGYEAAMAKGKAMQSLPKPWWGGGGAGITNDLTSGLLWGFPLVKPNCEMEDEWIQVILSVEVSLLGHRAECRRVEDGRCAWRNRKIITTVTFRISSWHRQLCCVWNSVCCFSASLAEVENVPFLYGRASGSKLEVLCL